LEGQPAAGVSGVTVERGEKIRSLLHQYVSHFGLDWGYPDDKIVRQVDAATRGSPLIDLDRILCSLLERKRKPKGWTFFPAVVKSEFEARRKAHDFRRKQAKAN
jgi:hypothetical protein